MTTPDKYIKRLNLLAIFHYILGGIVGLLSCAPLLFAVLGLILCLAGMRPEAHKGGFVVAFGLLFIIIGLVYAVLGWATAICMFITARNLKRKKRYRFCFGMVCLECIFVILLTLAIQIGVMTFKEPFGCLWLMLPPLILGIFTIIALSKKSVRATFVQPPAIGKETP
jgi:hypothetical protein